MKVCREHAVSVLANKEYDGDLNKYNNVILPKIENMGDEAVLADYLKEKDFSNYYEGFDVADVEGIDSEGTVFRVDELTATIEYYDDADDGYTVYFIPIKCPSFDQHFEIAGDVRSDFCDKFEAFGNETSESVESDVASIDEIKTYLENVGFSVTVEKAE